VPRCNYSACKVKCITGIVVEKPFTQIVPQAGVTTQSQSLAEFSATLKVGEYRAVNVNADQRSLEGTFWIAELLSEATEAEDNYEYGGEVVKVGYLVVKARWLECHSTERRTGARTYKAVSTDRYLNTNTLARISPVVLTAFPGDKLVLRRDEFDRISNSAL